MSDTTGTKVRAALIKAQAQMGTAKKDSRNPHFNSTYADLASVSAALHEPFASNGLGWRHDVWSDMEGVYVVCIIFHESGEEIRSEKPLFLPIPKKDPQAFKSGATYGKRTTLEAAAGISTDEDDDGNAASVRANEAPVAARPAQRPAQQELTEGERVAAEPQPVHHEPPHSAEEETVTPEGAYGPVLQWPDKHKGKHASELSANDLEFLINTERKKVDNPSAEAWKKKKAKAMLESLLAVRATKFGPYSGHDA